MRKFEIVSKYKDIEAQIRMPRRATKGSACYDIFNNTGNDITIPAGAISDAITTYVKIAMEQDEVCKFFVRSGHGFKYSLKLANSTGIVDCVPAGTLISTPAGNIAVETMMESAKQSIYSFNEQTNKVESDSISEMWIVNDLELLKIETEAGTVEVPVTKELFTRRGWVKASDLVDTDEILEISTNFSKISSITKTDTKPVFHLTVEKNHNFFGNGLCLHNCDYHNNSNNEGECFVKFHNQGPKELVIKAGEAMAQAMFQKYLITDDDNETVGGDRMGGFGSTSGT